MNHSRLLFCKERQEIFALGRSFVKSNKSESLPLLFRESNGSGSDSLLGIKRGKAMKNCLKHAKNMFFFAHFIRWNSKCNPCCSFLQGDERFAHGRSFVKSDKSKSFNNMSNF